MQSALLHSAQARPFMAGSGARAQRQLRFPVVRVATEETASTAKERKPSPLQKGGTLSGELAAGKDAGEMAKAMFAGVPVNAVRMQVIEGKFKDDRWTADGRWDLSQFKAKNGETDWDAVIDAEMARRRLLEDSPIPSTNEEPVNFDTAEIPWWAWVKRFHLPVAEKLNGRAAMLGYFLGAVVDQLSGVGLVAQQESFIGKLVLHLTVFGVLLIRENKDVDNYKNLLDEATFYDKQWQQSFEASKRPTETSQ